MNPELTTDDPHLCVTRQIPWYVNGTVDVAEASRLRAHLDACAQCRSDYEAQARLFAAMQADTTLVFAAEPSFQKLMARIGTDEDAAWPVAGQLPPAAEDPQPRVIVSRQAPRGALRWLAAAVVLEGLGLCFGVWAWHSQVARPGPAYATLTSAAPSYRDSPRIRIVFRPGLSLQGLGAILRDAHAHIIDGPTDSNVYTLGFTGGEVSPGVVERRSAALRANADVLFAEPVGAGAGDTGAGAK